MSAARMVRAGAARIYDHADATTVLAADGRALRFTGDSAALARAVLEFVAAPRTRGELLAHLAALAGEALDETSVVDELLAVLRGAGALHDAALARSAAPCPPRRLVLGLTGAVAAGQAPALVALLQRRGFAVRVALTAQARRFVGAASLEALTRAPVAVRPAAHLDLARWAEVVLVCPAAATTLARIARGSLDDLVAATALAARGPVVLVPAMDPVTYAAPAVQRNLDVLRGDGFYLVHPGAGAEAADAPVIEDVVGVVEAVVRERCAAPAAPAAPATPSGPSTPAEWEALHAAVAPGALPWFVEALDPEVAAALDALPGCLPGRPPGHSPGHSPGRLLDVGTGAGTAALEAARRGFAVVATDVAPSALAAARRRPGAERVTWLLDDVLATRLRGTFDVVLDRGCLHVLPADRHGDYAAAVADLTAPGGWLLLKTHGVRESRQWGTRRFAPADVVALLGRDFDLARAEDAPFPGPAAPGAARQGLFCLLRRKGAGE